MDSGSGTDLCKEPGVLQYNLFYCGLHVRERFRVGTIHAHQDRGLFLPDGVGILVSGSSTPKKHDSLVRTMVPNM